MERIMSSVIMITILTCLVSCNAWSQQGNLSGVRRSAFDLGFSFMSVRDEALNRIIHKGPGLHVDWYLELPGRGGISIIELGVGSGFLKSDFEEEISSFRFSGSAGFTYLWPLCINDQSPHFYLGGKVNARTAIEYFDNWDESHFYWTTAYTTGAGFRIEYTIRGNSMIRIEADIPLFSMVSRPPDRFLYTQSSPALKDILKDVNYDLSLLLPREYREFDMRVKYAVKNRKRIMPEIFWRLHYMSIHKDGSARMKYLLQSIGVEFDI